MGRSKKSGRRGFLKGAVAFAARSQNTPTQERAEGSASAGGMPPYTSKVMSGADLADVRAYLASIPEPPPVKDIPLLRP